MNDTGLEIFSGLVTHEQGRMLNPIECTTPQQGNTVTVECK